MSSNPHGLTVGQTLYWVYHDKRRGNPQNVQVTKVGRKWAELSNLRRIDLESLSVDGGDWASPARCWLTREAHETESARRADWESIARSLRYAPLPDGVTAADIAAARKLLRLDPPEATS